MARSNVSAEAMTAAPLRTTGTHVTMLDPGMDGSVVACSGAAPVRPSQKPVARVGTDMAAWAPERPIRVSTTTSVDDGCSQASMAVLMLTLRLLASWFSIAWRTAW